MSSLRPIRQEVDFHEIYRDILLTEVKWNLAVNIALDDCVHLSQGMRFILAQIQRNIALHQSPNNTILDIRYSLRISETVTQNY
jgi:hypothetical protein